MTYCTGKADVDQVAVAGDVHLFEVVQQRGALVPRRVGRPVTTLSPLSADIGMMVRSGCRAWPRRRNSSRIFSKRLGVVDQVHLVDREHEVRDAQQRGQEGVATGLLEQPLRASTSTITSVGRGGPVTMLRVYCTWPGVSAMMNLRSAVAK
jgi:hypothetical protein